LQKKQNDPDMDEAQSISIDVETAMHLPIEKEKSWPSKGMSFGFFFV
jgi:hypothetical protein